MLRNELSDDEKAGTARRELIINCISRYYDLHAVPYALLCPCWVYEARTVAAPGLVFVSEKISTYRKHRKTSVVAPNALEYLELDISSRYGRGRYATRM